MPRAPLDVRIGEIREQPGRTWGVPDALLGLLAVPVALLLLRLLVSAGLGLPPLVAAAISTAGLAALAALAGRRAARQSGGWQAALGLSLPEWSDGGRIAGWTILLLLAQTGSVVLLQVAVPPLRGAVADNASYLGRQDLGYLVVFAVLAVGVAPVVEELLFRGLVLRGLMLRAGFWPAAVVSSALFGAFHAQGTDTGSVLLITANGVLGLGLCVLTRRTGRLGPGIGVHAVRNALAVLLVVVASSR